MPKVISNGPNPQDPNNSDKVPFPSPICKQVIKGNINVSQLYCCDRNTEECVADISNCNVSNNHVISQCQNITTLDACRRTDTNSSRVCE